MVAQDHLFAGAGGTTGSFLVEIDDVPIGRFTECQGLEVEIELETYEEGGVNGFVHKLPGRMVWPHIVLRRGVTWSNDVFDWFNKAAGANFVAHGKATRHPVGITMVSSTGERLRSWTLIDAIPVKWSGPTFNTSTDEIATEELEVAHHGFEVETHRS